MRRHNPKSTVMMLVTAIIIAYLCAVMAGVVSCIVAWFRGMDTSGCQGAFERPFAALLAAVTALWAAEYTKKNPPNNKP